MLLLGLISSSSLLVEYLLDILISTYKTILHFYVVIIKDLIELTPISRLRKLSKKL